MSLLARIGLAQKLRQVSCIVFLLLAVSGWAADLTVTVEGAPQTGSLVFLFFDSAEAWDGFRMPFKTLTFQSDPETEYSITDLTAGEYALLVYHDENSNGQLDRNFIGIPKEPVGFSNGYRPKGPPNFRKAAFRLADDASYHYKIPLTRPLGKRGRLGVGIGVLGKSSPYSKATGSPILAIPVITYIGERVQIFGPYAQIGIVGSGDVRLAATLAYRLGSYEESDSPVLAGMGDRKQTIMGGLSLEWEWDAGVDVSFSAQRDALNRIHASAAQLGMSRPFSLGRTRLSPSVALNWQNAKLANHEFGVPADKATPTRPAYKLDDIISVEGGMGCFIELPKDWAFIVNMNVEFLNSDVTDSPIVSEDYVLKGFAALNVVL